MQEINFKELFDVGKEKNRIENFIKKFKKPLKVINYIFKIFVIIIVLFLIIEFFSFSLVEIYRSIVPNEDLNMDIYKNKTEAKEFFKEVRDSYKFEYFPYLGYRKIPNFHGKYIQLDENSIRKTESSCSNLSNKSISIFVFGGSTVWGSSVKNWETIPSYLSEYLCNKDISVEVINFGEDGYTSTQGLIRLELELRKGNYPDIVVFYQGINDVFSSYQNDAAGLPQNMEDRKKDFNSRKKLNIIGSLLHSNFMTKIMNRIAKPFRRQALKKDLDKKTAWIYLNNINIVKALEQAFKFKTFFYWQPSFYSKAIYSKEEKKIEDNKVRRELYINVTRKIKENEGIKDLSGIFNDKNNTIFTDCCHVTNEGNKIIAEYIGGDIENYLKS